MAHRRNPGAIFHTIQPHANLYSHVFEFGQERRTQDKVKQWYRSLQVEQLPTEFFSIAYMKDQGTKFEHEFLLIYLTSKDTPDDYSFVCCVERRGNGSRVQALLSGDYSRDTLHIFSKEAYTKFELSYHCSVRHVLGIQFQRRLDLLRILELCYSLQESDTSARYTLFRFNCYFMCWMILINLVRGIDRWDDRLDTEAWGRMVTERLPQLINTWVPLDNTSSSSSCQCACNPPATSGQFPSPQIPLNDIAQHLCFCILKTMMVLGPESNRVVTMIADSIQTELKFACDQLLHAINSHNSSNLFPSDVHLHEAVRKCLSVQLSAAAAKVLWQDKRSGQRRWSLLNDSDPSHWGSTEVFSPEFEARIAKELHKLWFGRIRDYLGGDEFQSKARCGAPGATGGPLMARLKRYCNSELVPLVPQLRIWRESYEHAVVEILGACPNGARKGLVNPSYLSFKHWESYRKQILPVVMSDRADVQTASQEVSQDYRILATHMLLFLAPTKHSDSLVDPQIWLGRYFKSSDWTYCFNKCISKAIYDSLVPLDKPLLRVEMVQDGTSIQKMWRYREFYDFLKVRIEDHAIMAERYKGSTRPIGSSRENRNGIHDAIQKIWGSRPTFSKPESSPV